ncbi:MAG TPA: hypothetical protein VIC26_15690 [Marinagarivorans sp.]
MIDIAAIDQFLGQHGQFNLLDWLLENSYLAYSDYEQWRYGKQAVLTPLISLDKSAIKELATQANRLCKKLKLCEEDQAYFAWDGQQHKHLRIDGDSALQEAFCKKWLRAQDVPQLDLFMDNSAIVTENKLCDALANRQFDLASSLIKELTTLNPNNHKLGGYQSLLLYSQHITNNIDIAPEALAAELAGLEDEVLPLAQNLLQRGARDYLAVAWKRIASNLDNVPYNAEQPKLHNSYAIAQIPDWQTVTRQLLNQALTYEHCELLVRLADAFYYLNDQAKSRFCWVLAFERFPQQAELLLEKSKPVSVLALWEDFCDLNDAWPDVFFAGFILASEPSLIYQAEYFPAFSQSTTQLVADLMAKKLAGDDEITARQNVQNYSPALLRMVMSV